MCSLLRQHMILTFRAASNSTGADTWHIVHVLEPQSCGKLPSYNKEHESEFDCCFLLPLSVKADLTLNNSILKRVYSLSVLDHSPRF